VAQLGVAKTGFSYLYLHYFYAWYNGVSFKASTFLIRMLIK